MKTKCLLYCTKDKNLLRKVVEYDESSMTWYQPHYEIINDKNCDFDILNGTIVAEYEVECEEHRPFFHWCIEKKTCLTRDDVLDYLDNKDKFVGNPKRQGKVYALNISNLKVFDKPLELSEVKYYKKFSEIDYMLPIPRKETCERLVALTRAPQNMMWVWYKGERYCLISTRPQWACKTLNGEKTIEVRKQVLKDMIKENRKAEYVNE